MRKKNKHVLLFIYIGFKTHLLFLVTVVVFSILLQVAFATNRTTTIILTKLSFFLLSFVSFVRCAVALGF